MCRPTCPFAAALFGSIAGSASGAALGAMAGWLLSAGYARGGGPDPQGLAILVFGTLGTAIGGSGGAAGGIVGGSGLAEGSAARWGGGLGALWGLQPILWLATRGEVVWALVRGVEVLAVVVALGAIAGVVGRSTARRLARALEPIPSTRRP